MASFCDEHIYKKKKLINHLSNYSEIFILETNIKNNSVNFYQDFPVMNLICFTNKRVLAHLLIITPPNNCPTPPTPPLDLIQPPLELKQSTSLTMF